MEDYRKINRWLEIHWKTVLIIVALATPIIVYKLAVNFTIEGVISANNIFTGLIAFLGIIISFWGIYWKTTREEKYKAKGIYSVFLHTFEENNYYKNTDFFIKFISQRYSLKSERTHFFYNINSDFVEKNLELILLQDFGSEFLRYYTKVDEINKLVKENNEGIIEKVISKIENVQNLQKDELEKNILSFLLTELGLLQLALFTTKEPDTLAYEIFYDKVLANGIRSNGYKEDFYIEFHGENKQNIYDFKLKAISNFIIKCITYHSIKNTSELLMEIISTINQERLLIVDVVGKAHLIMDLNEKYLKWKDYRYKQQDS